MRLREILAEDCQELLQKQEKLFYVISGANQSGIIQKSKNLLNLLNKTELGYLFLNTFREKILCVIDLPVLQCISLNDFTKKIDRRNSDRQLNICKQYIFNLPTHKLIPWNCTRIDSSISKVKFYVASNLPAISIPELFEHIIGFFQHSILLQPFDFHLWKLAEKLQRKRKKCFSLAKCKSKTLFIGEIKNFENEVEIKKITKEMDEKEQSVATKTLLYLKLQNSQLYQNTIFDLSDEKNTEVRNEVGDQHLLNFPKSFFSSVKKQINLRDFELSIVEKPIKDIEACLFNCKNLNWHSQFADSVRIPCQLVISKRNNNIKWVSCDDDNNRSNSDGCQSQMIKKFKDTSCDTDDNTFMDMSFEFTEKKEDIQDRKIEIIDTCNFVFGLHKKHYQNNESYFSTNCPHSIKYTNKAIYSDVESERSIKSINANIKTFGLSNIYNEEYKLCKEPWTTLLINFNVQTIAMHIKKLMPMFLYSSESISYLPKHMISCNLYQHGFNSEYKTQKSIALGNKAQLSDKSLISVQYTGSCSNFQATIHIKELDANSRIVTYKPLAQPHEEPLHISALPNENRHITDIPVPSKSDSLKENLITASLSNLNEEGYSCNAIESKSQSFVTNDNHLNASSWKEIASRQNKNSAQMKSSVSTEGNINCSEYRNPDYNYWANMVQDSRFISLKRKQPFLCKDYALSADSESNKKNCIPSKPRAEQDGDKTKRLSELKMHENEQYNEYKVIKRPRLQVKESECFHKDSQCSACSYEKGENYHDQIVPANNDHLSIPEESTSLYNNCLLGKLLLFLLIFLYFMKNHI